MLALWMYFWAENDWEGNPPPATQSGSEAFSRAPRMQGYRRLLR